uniref:Glutamyl-tRNA(Gln) amidotransferase subunit C, mitochondrial n=1 Tax=Spongospora subterranea TaxID=70186 RepID=A0A0H5RB41_9EUKA|eukprot:CRZ11026.1 hypothetical protein [Spongospora subterranea]
MSSVCSQLSRFRLPPASWSLQSATRAGPLTFDIDTVKLQSMCKLSLPDAENQIRPVLSWIDQIRRAEIPANVPPTVSPLDFWGITMRFDDDDGVEDPAVDVLSNAANHEFSLFKLPRPNVQ